LQTYIHDKERERESQTQKNILPHSKLCGILCVIPAKAGIQTLISIQKKDILDWIPSSEGMTIHFAASSEVLNR